MVKGRKHSSAIRQSRGDQLFDVVNVILMSLFLFIMAYPLYFTVIASISDINEVGLGNVYLWPKGFTLDAYKNVLINDSVWIGYGNSLFYTAAGTAYGLLIMVPVAYGLSKKHLLGHGLLTWFFLLTMYFSGGLVPSYILIKNLGLTNTRWVLIVGSVSVYNMIVTRTYFSTSIPNELYESASMDGAGEWWCFFRIALPLATPIIAVMSLYFAVSQWNSYFSAMIYINKKQLFPLQLVLRNILILNQQMMMDPEYFSTLSADEQSAVMAKARLAESMKYAVVFIASAPMLIAYPFVQKYFVKGIMIGSLKG